ncbi:Ger(x)C family spore germination protein [Virgibacillus necropolis]|uniref:Ger(x)C family spore germination protein n=1 Tax=Virgibacillus necropolis TaxID=163877 RepID=UPI00384AB625
MNKKLLILLLLIFITMLNGCLPSKEIESLGIINTRGVDISDEGKLETTIIYFQFDSQTKDITEIVKGVGETIKGARANANFKTNYELTPGQIRLELYGMEAAKKGLIQYVDTLARDAKAADTMYLAVSDTTAKSILTTDQEGFSKNIGHFLYRLLEQTIKDDVIPRTTLQDFIHVYYDVGKDPILPMLKIQEGKPYLYAMAVFKDDKYVGKISTSDAFLLNMLEKSVESTMLELELPLKPFKKHLANSGDKKDDKKTFNVLLSVLNGKGKTKIDNFKNLTFETHVEVDLRLLELTKQIKLTNPKVEALLEKEIEKNLEQQYEDLLAKVKELNADPFGYGNIYRSHKKNGKLKDKVWRDKFPNIKVNFQVDAKILRHGITE